MRSRVNAKCDDSTILCDGPVQQSGFKFDSFDVAVILASLFHGARTAFNTYFHLCLRCAHDGSRGGPAQDHQHLLVARVGIRAHVPHTTPSEQRHVPDLRYTSLSLIFGRGELAECVAFRATHALYHCCCRGLEAGCPSPVALDCRRPLLPTSPPSWHVAQWRW